MLRRVTNTGEDGYLSQHIYLGDLWHPVSPGPSQRTSEREDSVKTGGVTVLTDMALLNLFTYSHSSIST